MPNVNKRYLIGVAVAIGLVLFAVALWLGLKRKVENTPPIIEDYPFVLNGTTIYCNEGKTSATVFWNQPHISDKEDGVITVISTPNFISGTDFKEGKYNISFAGTDKYGLFVSASIAFEVKVHRCIITLSPAHKTITCETNDIIWGTTCSVQCNAGYNISDGESTSMKCEKWARWIPVSPPSCKPLACEHIVIKHGYVSCTDKSIVFNGKCVVVCEDGYEVDGNPRIACNENGQWGLVPRCLDVMPPRFLMGECPRDIEVYVDSVDSTAKVDWNVPKGTDNSNESVTIVEVNGYSPGGRMQAGSYSINYTIVDSNNNFGEPCAFQVHVKGIFCDTPILNITGADRLTFNCPQGYRFGANCTLGCESGYPNGGANHIYCVVNNDSFPPQPYWKWDENDIPPFCRETNCSRDALREPKNGVLACSEWTHGQICQIQCQSGYDIPNLGDGMFICGTYDGIWRPTTIVPNCNKAYDADFINLPNKIYYYFTGQCNHSIETVKQIQENFVQALNASVYHEECRDVPECQAKFVGITCGPVAKRRKRSTNDIIVRRATTSMAYTLRFDFILHFRCFPGKTADEIFSENETVLSRMTLAMQKEWSSGHFNLHIKGLLFESVVYEPGRTELIFSNGTLAIKNTNTHGR